ncbi:MAG: InlB B-repeat-containing protein [Ruminococcus sp.]|nr:InlB B-repeat-containing protein [Ruminococcus sp.]
MTAKFLKIRSLLTNNSLFRKNLILIVVALIEVIAIMVVSTSAWVETISTVEISGDTGKIAAPIFTTARFDGTNRSLDLTKYFNASGNVHLSSASSADGKNIFFPKVNTSPVKYRRGTINDANVNYINFSIIIDATNASGDLNFFFDSSPIITVGGKTVNDSSVRIAISKEYEDAKIFSKSESADKAVVDEDGSKGDTSVNRFSTYINMEEDEEQEPIFDVEYGKTAEVNFTLWLEDPNMSSKYTGQKVEIKNLELVTDTKEYVVSFVDRTTSFYNGGTKNGLYWVENDNSQMWVYSSGANKALKMTQAVDDPRLWSANIQEFLQYRNSDLYFLRTSSTATNPTPNSDNSIVYNKWKTKLSEDTNSDKTYTAYSNVVGSTDKFGTWGEVTEILLDSEATSVLPKPAKASEHTGADITLTISGVSYEMNYKHYNGSALWRCYLPTESLEDKDAATFKFTRNGTTYTYNADKRGDSVKYFVTSSNTGYWYPPAVIKIISGTDTGSVDSGTVLGTASASVGNYRGTEIKVTPGTAVTLSATNSNYYKFVGWYTSSDYTVPAKLTDGNKFTPQKSQTYTFYAKFQRQYYVQLTAVTGDSYPNSTGGTVQFKDEQATNQVKKSLLAGDSENTNVKFTAAVSDTNSYEFRGWYTNAEGTGNAFSTNLVCDIGTVDKDYTLYAKFMPKEVTVKAVAMPTGQFGNSKVTFSEPTGASEGTEVQVQVFINGYATFLAKPDTSNGYEFEGWYTDKDLKNKVSGAGAEYRTKITKETTLYAKFKLKNVTLTAKAVTGTSLSSDGGTVKITGGTASTASATDSKTVEYGSAVTLTATPKDGYEFKGWYTGATDGSAISGIANGGSYTNATITLSSVKADTTVYARFATKNRVYFANNPVDGDRYSSDKQWQTPYCYVWQNGGSSNNGSFPGVAMSYDDSLGLYYYDITTSNVNKVIFSGGSGKPQTEDLDLVIGATYYLKAKSGEKYPATTQGGGNDDNTVTYYFVGESGWNSYSVYYNNKWKSGTKTDAWEQGLMTDSGKTYGGRKIWFATFPKDDIMYNIGFAIKNGNTQVSYLEPVQGETALTNYDGKMYDATSKKWINYTHD